MQRNETLGVAPPNANDWQSTIYCPGISRCLAFETFLPFETRPNCRVNPSCRSKAEGQMSQKPAPRRPTELLEESAARADEFAAAGDHEARRHGAG